MIMSHRLKAALAFLATLCVVGFVSAAGEREALTIRTSAAEERFDVEIANSPEERAKGLMFRESLGTREGMLFEFDELRPVAFWMKNTLIPLDMLFLGPDGTIVGIAAQTEPLSEKPIGSPMPVKAVLELPGGTAEALGIAVGDRVHHPFFGL